MTVFSWQSIFQAVKIALLLIGSSDLTDVFESKGKGEPSVLRDIFGFCPVGSDIDKVAYHQPDTDVRHHTHDHPHSRKPQPSKQQPFFYCLHILSAVKNVIFLFFLHLIFFLSDKFLKIESTDSLESVLLFVAYPASAAPSFSQAARASSSGASFAITKSAATSAPRDLTSSSQFLIHSPSPQP